MSCNVYNDVIALRGLLEKSSEYFDELFAQQAEGLRHRHHHHVVYSKDQNHPNQ